jgi:hypothetical protein
MEEDWQQTQLILPIRFEDLATPQEDNRFALSYCIPIPALDKALSGNVPVCPGPHCFQSRRNA